MPEGCCLPAVRPFDSLDLFGTVDTENAARENEMVCFQPPPRRNWGQASAVECRQHRPFGENSGMGFRVIQRQERRSRGFVVGAGFQSECALADGGEHDLRCDPFGNPAREAQTVEAGLCQDDRVVLACIKFREPRIDISADIGEIQVRAVVQKLGLAAKAAGSDSGTPGQLGKGWRLSADKDIADRLALGYCRQHQSGNRLGGKILQAVYGQVDAALKQGVLDFLGEYALTAECPDRTALSSIPRGRDRHKFDHQPQGLQTGGDPVSLPSRQGAGPCAESDGR